MQLPTFQLLDTGPRSIEAVKMLRISVTDRCNFRCVYCMPHAGVAWLPKDEILSFEEIGEVVRAAIEIHGIRRFKLTGGEPTVRHGLCDLVALLRRSGEIDELSLTTNGFLLEGLAGPLKEAGLDRATVSIDSLQPERFKQITRTGDLAAVMRGLDRAEAVGLLPLKINCVAMRGTNDDEFADFARLTLNRRVTVRFIEYMPLGDSQIGYRGSGVGFRVEDKNRSRHLHLLDPTPDPRHPTPELGPSAGCGSQDRGENAFIAEAQIREAIESELGPLIPVERITESGVGPAVPYRLARGNPLGRVAFISAMSQPFCSTCNRLRLTATGMLRSCLFEGGEVDVRSILRGNGSADRRRALADAMTECVRLKPDVHSYHGNEQMSRIGG